MNIFNFLLPCDARDLLKLLADSDHFLLEKNGVSHKGRNFIITSYILDFERENLLLKGTLTYSGESVQKRGKKQLFDVALQVEIIEEFLEQELTNAMHRFRNALAANAHYAEMVQLHRTRVKARYADEGFRPYLADFVECLQRYSTAIIEQYTKQLTKSVPVIEQITRYKVKNKPPGVTAFGVNLNTFAVEEIETFLAPVEEKTVQLEAILPGEVQNNKLTEYTPATESNRQQSRGSSRRERNHHLRIIAGLVRWKNATAGTSIDDLTSSESKLISKQAYYNYINNNLAYTDDDMAQHGSSFSALWSAYNSGQLEKEITEILET